MLSVMRFDRLERLQQPVLARGSMTWRWPLAAVVAISVALFLAQLVLYGLGTVDIIMLDWDRGHYMDASRRFLETGQPYLAWEIAGPFDYTPLTFLHPPLALWLMVPFTFVPDVLWYLVPVAIILAVIASWRPSPIALALVGLCILWPRTPAMVVTGNTDMWVAAFVALGLRFGWVGPFVVIKPSLGPLALAGIHRRSWWLGLGLAVAMSIPFGLLWYDWFRVVTNSPGGLLYSALALPGTIFPLFAWWGRRTDR
jgi:4-amino-4-deoxy-L-arabinose transferase-like glycosyltransferase